MDNVSTEEMMRVEDRFERVSLHLETTSSALEEWRRVAETDPQAFERLRE